MFSRVCACVFPCVQKDFKHYEGCVAAIRELSPGARIFCLVHKMDLVPLPTRTEARALRVCVRARMCACVRACVFVCVHVCICVCVCVSA